MAVPYQFIPASMAAPSATKTVGMSMAMERELRSMLRMPMAWEIISSEAYTAITEMDIAEIEPVIMTGALMRKTMTGSSIEVRSTCDNNVIVC